jgi:hypothetical protein
MTGLDFNRAIAAHFGLPTGQVDAFATKLHHGVGEQIAVTLTINLTALDLQTIGQIMGGLEQIERRRVSRDADLMIVGAPLGRGKGIQ